MKRIISLLLLLALLAMSLSGCAVFGNLLKRQPESETTANDKETVEQMIERCNTACNDVDLAGILDCVSPQVAGPLRMGLNIAGSLGGKSDEELLNAILDFLGADIAGNSEEICQTLEIDVVSVDTKGDAAEVGVTFSFTQDGKDYTGETNVTCIFIDGRWYISKFSV